MRKLSFVFILLVLLSLLFVYRIVAQGNLPIPSDTIVGLYHPYRDLFASVYPRGFPFKNFLITDPVRQQYPWRYLAIDSLRHLQLPLWNPYTMSGTPLLGTLQEAVFYPFNILFFILPFSTAWSLLIFLQPILAGLFLYLYLTEIRLHRYAALLGGLTFGLCGFSVAWLEWNTVVQAGLWLPFILLSIEKMLHQAGNKKQKKGWSYDYHEFLWLFVLAFSLIFSFFAGHLQTFFYVFIVTALYFLFRWISEGRRKKILARFFIALVLFVLVTAIQWIPTLQFILLSARDVDQANWMQLGWFLPWQHLLQFIAPDFFGNPTTLNYWGVWNYGEFIGYVSIFPLIMSLFALLNRRDKYTLFFSSVCFLSLFFALPNVISQLPYQLHIPFLSTAQPTRLLFLADFSLAVLAALGTDLFLRDRKKVFYPAGVIGIILLIAWFLVLVHPISFFLKPENALTARRNLYLPSIVYGVTLFGFVVSYIDKKNRFPLFVISLFLLVTVFDLVRFADKFLPFTSSSFLYPQTKSLRYLQRYAGNYRIMANDSRILPPNFSVMYNLQTVEGYDPLYLRRYGELIAASERQRPDIAPPFGFNRIITPHAMDARITNLLGVKYVLSLSDIASPGFRKVSQEGDTRVYENTHVMPRAFFVNRAREIVGENKQQAIQLLFDKQIHLQNTAVVEHAEKSQTKPFSQGKVTILSYTPNAIVLKTKNAGNGFLVMTDSYYPTWHAKIDGVATPIYLTDYAFRGIVVPKGQHTVRFYPTVF